MLKELAYYCFWISLVTRVSAGFKCLKVWGGGAIWGAQNNLKKKFLDGPFNLMRIWIIERSALLKRVKLNQQNRPIRAQRPWQLIITVLSEMTSAVSEKMAALMLCRTRRG